MSDSTVDARNAMMQIMMEMMKIVIAATVMMRVMIMLLMAMVIMKTMMMIEVAEIIICDDNNEYDGGETMIMIKQTPCKLLKNNATSLQKLLLIKSGSLLAQSSWKG